MGLFDFFSKGKVIYKPSLFFLNHDLKDKYFYRTIQFRYLDDKGSIMAMDNMSATVYTFDPWPQQIFLSATGQKTVYEFLIDMSKRYRGQVPELLDKTIIEELEKLVNIGRIKLSDEPVKLATEILLPRNK